ncbi:MAG: aldehyde dehydrogenase family protein [Steroidobacteraceae bacterium]
MSAPQASPVAPRRLAVRNPRTGRDDYSIDVADAAQLRALATRLRSAQPAWSASGARARATVLRRWADAIQALREPLIEALATDTGRYAISVGEVDSVMRNIRRWAEQGPALIEESEFASRLLPTVTIRDQYVPYALVACISPWNFPVTLSLIDAVPAAMAGCAVIVKPSEVTPRFAEPLRASLQQVPELAAVFALVTGDGETGRALVDCADAVCFTGSVATGRKVAEAAAARFIGIPRAGWQGSGDRAAQRRSRDGDDVVLRGAVSNNGHACMSLERIYVDRAILAPFLALLVQKAQAVTLAYPDPRKVTSVR